MLFTAPAPAAPAILKSLFGSPPRPSARPSEDSLLPRIETDRLILRPPALDDYPVLREMTADPAMFAYSERGAMGADEAWTLLLRQIGGWTALGYGVFTVLDRESGEVMGQVGASRFQRGLGLDFDRHPELSWSIREGWRGRGFATEAARASLSWLDRSLRARRSVCLINGGNAASLRVAFKLGFRPFRACAYRGYSAALLERLRGAP